MITSEQVVATTIATSATIIKATTATIEDVKAGVSNSGGQTSVIVESTSRAFTHGTNAATTQKVQTI